jgi:predicted RNase H-like HicB family nuclease
MANSTSVAYPRTVPYFEVPEIISPERRFWKFLRDYSSQATLTLRSSLTKLVTKQLRQPINIVIEEDDGGYLARCPALPLYGCGDSVDEAVGMLQREIESLYEDLLEDDSFTEDWRPVKAYLEERIN